MKLILIGYGKMGQTIGHLAKEKGHDILYIITSASTSELTPARLQPADCVMEFTRPDAAFGNLIRCIDAGVPVVSGTTGWQHQVEELKNYCLKKNGAVVWSPNFSPGINILFELTGRLASLIKGQPFSISIEETHHIHKRDRPSGTALQLASIFIQAGLYKGWTFDENQPGLLLVRSERKGDVTGIHTLCCEGQHERLLFTHQADSRLAFASGALMAAEWIAGKKGFYSMIDVMGLTAFTQE
jgi:4-hydroxy-tetrahydrodipicolinate reductase